MSLVDGDRQRIADRLAESPLEYLAQAVALGLVGQARIGRLDVDRQLAFAPKVVAEVFVAGEDVAPVDAETKREAMQELARLLGLRAVVIALARQQCRVVPDRHAVPAPEEIERPARQLLARVPLALAVVDQAAAA